MTGGRVLTGLACAIADCGGVISDFRVIGDQGDLFGRARYPPRGGRWMRSPATGVRWQDRRRASELPVGGLQHFSPQVRRVGDRAAVAVEGNSDCLLPNGSV